jgi:hypothetical protein
MCTAKNSYLRSREVRWKARFFYNILCVNVMIILEDAMKSSTVNPYDLIELLVSVHDLNH